MNYTPAQTIPEGEYQLAAYAYGKDYHDVMKARLRELMAVIASLQPRPRPLSLREGTGWGCFVDTAPVLERYWAVQAGLGWTGRNHQLIIPRAGSMFFLGEIFLPCEVDAYDHPMPSRCGNCHRCLDACPTHAIREGEPFDAHRCLSYQLIENRRQLSPEACRVMGDTIYGCDRCQTVCPWNRFASPNTETAFQPSPDLLAMTKKDWQRLTADDYRRLFKGSAVKRAKYEGLMRNIERHSSTATAETRPPVSPTPAERNWRKSHRSRKGFFPQIPPPFFLCPLVFYPYLCSMNGTIIGLLLPFVGTILGSSFVFS